MVWSEAADDDRFNNLLVATDANWREVSMLRAYTRYLKQTNYSHSFEFTLKTLLNNPQICNDLIRLFKAKFESNKQKNPEIISSIYNTITERLKEIKSIAEDKVISTLLELIMATKRTNFYQLDHNGHFKDYISFKISSSELSFIPQPKPYAEIFVYSPRVEGIHLRGGKIARGGIRWSDRREDFRTEVLGLMKAQTPKNSIIVPVGSKGGFVVKKVTPTDGKEAFMTEGIH